MKKIIVFTLLVLLTGCGDFSLPPKEIIADGVTYHACGGFYVRTATDGVFGSNSYKLEFTDKYGDQVRLRGISKVSVRDIPKEFSFSLPPSLPNPTRDKDWDGQPFLEGTTYFWRAGTAILRDGKWNIVSGPNPVCDAQSRRIWSEPSKTEPFDSMPNDPPASVTLEQWETMTPSQQAGFKGVIDLPPRPKSTPQ